MFKDSLHIIAILIVVAGLAYYGLKRTGYIEGLETKESEPANVVKTTDEKKRTII